MAVISIQRDTNNNVCIVRIISTDTIAAVSSPNYITQQQANINALNGGVFAWFSSDIILVAASDGNGIFTFDDGMFNTLFPIASGTVSPGLANEIAYYPSNGSTVAGLSTANNGVLVTNNSGIPSISATLPSQVQLNITQVGTIGTGTWNGSQITVPYGGTGNDAFTAFSVICAGTTATGPFQNVAGLGTATYVLTSNGPGALPTWQISAGSGTVQPGTINDLAFYTATGNSVGPLPTSNNGVLITSGLGVPSISSTLPLAVQSNITQLGTQTQALNMGGFQINNVADPTHAQDAATMNYVSNISAGLNPVAGVYAASTVNLAGYVYNNGAAGVGATLTAGTVGVFTLNGVSPPVGSRVLYKNDTTYAGVANGIYTVTTSSAGSDAILTRWTGYDTPNQIHVGDLLSVENGTTNGGSAWYQTDVVSAIGTSPIAFSIWFNPASYLSSVLANGTIYIGNASNVATQSTTTWPATSTINQILYSSAANTITGLPTLANAVLVTSAGGVPSLSTTLPAGLTIPGYQPSLTFPLSLALGGTGAALTASAGSVPYSGASALALSAVGTSGQLFQSAGAGIPGWTTAIYPATTTINQLFYSSTANHVTGLATLANGVLVTSAGGVPSVSTTLPSGLTIPGYQTTVTLPFIVGANGPYTTIQSAINAASAVATLTQQQQVLINPGTYTEDLTLLDYVHCSCFGSSDVAVTVNGTATYTSSVSGGILSLDSLSLTATNAGSPALSVNGSSTCTLNMDNCTFTAQAGPCFSFDNPNATVFKSNSTDFAPSGQQVFNVTAGTITINGCLIVSTDTASTVAGGTIKILGGFVTDAFVLSSGAGVLVNNSVIQSGAALSTFTISTGGEVICLNSSIDCFATSGYWATGTGNLIYNGVTSVLGSASEIDPAVSAFALPLLVGSLSFNGGISTFTASGNFNVIQTYTGSTNVTFPTTGTLATVGGTVSSALPNGDIIVGNASNVAAAVAMSGDATIVNTGAITLKTVNTNVGTFGNSTNVGTFTVNAKGLITAASNVAIAAGSGTVTSGLINQLAWYSSAGTTVSGLTIVNSAGLTTTSGGVPTWVAYTGTGAPVLGTTPTINQPNIVGVTTNSNAAAGSVGEFISSVIPIASAITFINGTPTNVTSISLSAGDYNVWGNAVIATTGTATPTIFLAWVSSSSATFPDASLYTGINMASAILAQDCGISALSQRFSLSATTTVYITAYFSGGTGNGTVCGGIYARRVR